MENQSKNKAEIKQNYTENNMEKNMDEIKRDVIWIQDGEWEWI